MNNWKGIFMAPRNRRILLFDPNYWNTPQKHWSNTDGAMVGEGRWIGLTERWRLEGNKQAEFNPTHWQELPDGPNGEHGVYPHKTSI